MYFPDDKRYYFEKIFRKRMAAVGVSMYAEYYRYIRNGHTRREELVHLMNEITVNETKFFSDQAQFDALKKIFLPEIVRKREALGEREVSIWSAGCSSGEETYSIAMAVAELRTGILEGWGVEIIGTDISHRVLQMAEKGLYRGFQVRHIPDDYLKKYMVPEEREYRVSDEIKNLVRFEYHNLNEVDTKIAQNVDVIFCKNVLIYFDHQSKARVVRHLFETLNEDGCLFVGFSESLYGVDHGFTLVHYPGGMGYRKTG